MDSRTLLPLHPRLIQVLVSIHEKAAEPITRADITKLLELGYIAQRQPGWALSSKGRELIKKLQQRPGKKSITDIVID